jgi:signal transduction histidine kinase
LHLLDPAFAGAISVTLGWCGERVELSVRDTGGGIPADALPHIFERCHRVRGVRSHTHEGIGIGLALVHELVKLHGGDVRRGIVKHIFPRVQRSAEAPRNSHDNVV